MQLRASAEARGFFYRYPDGLESFWNGYFWNDADAAAFRLPSTDDVGFLRGLIQEVGRHFALDRKRVYLIGHSNDSVMANRMACESADLVASIAGFAGLRLLDVGFCEPSEPVNILHIHGTADVRVFYWGGGSATNWRSVIMASFEFLTAFQ